MLRNIFKTNAALQEALNILSSLGALQGKQLKDGYDIGYIYTKNKKQFFSSLYKHKRDIFIKTFKNYKENDIVIIRLWQNKCQVLAVFKKYSKNIIGYLVENGNQKCIKSFKDNKVIALKVKQKALKPLPPLSVFVLSEDGAILEFLGNLSNPYVDELIVLAQQDLLYPFSRQALLEAKSFGSEVDVQMYQERMNLCHLPFCTIDPEDAKDFDDALFYDDIRGELYVAIADVSEYVTPYSTIDKEARRKGFSIYLPHKCFPMLPEVLSENLCSLKPYQNRLVYVWKFRVHKGHGAILKQELFQAIICSQRRFTYDEVNAILCNKPLNSMDIMLHKLHAQMQRCRKKRLHSGFAFTNNDKKVILDDSLHFIKTLDVPDTFAHQLVEEAMLIANRAAADCLAQKFSSALYRVHDSPQYARVSEVFMLMRARGYKATLTKDIHKSIVSLQKEAFIKGEQDEVDSLLIKAQSLAEYSPLCSLHFGLGFVHYTHFTSPIRRYTDLCVHRLLKYNWYANKETELAMQMKDICNEMNALERRSAYAETEFINRVYVRWARENIGAIIEAYIINEHYPPLAKAYSIIAGAKLIIDDKDLLMGEKILAQIISSDLISAKILCRVYKRFNHVS